MKDTIRPQPELKTGTYRHYSGKLYKVSGLACHSETLEWYVLYEPLYEHTGMPDTWIRPYDMFTEQVEVAGKPVPRFEYIDNS